MNLQNRLTYIRANWFWPVFAGLFGLVWAIAKSHPDTVTQQFELAVLFDIFVTVPALYFLCYRRQLSTPAMFLRIVGLQCFGIWLATNIVAPDKQSALAQLSWLRNLGLAVLVAFEVWLAVKLARIVFRQETRVADLEREGVPLIIAKLMLLEARFWRWVFSRF